MSNSDLLVLACFQGHLDQVTRIIAKNQDETNKSGNQHDANNDAEQLPVLDITEAAHHASGYNPLLAACLGGHLSVVRYLLEEIGVNPHATHSTSHMTGLGIACARGHLSVVQYWYERNVHDPNDAAPLVIACGWGQLEIANYFVAKATLSSSSDILNASNSLGVNPLLAACFGGHLPMVAWIVHEAGVDKEATHGATKKTGLAVACERGHLAIVQFLIEQAACSHLVEARSAYNFTPLHIACSVGKLPIVQYLIEVACAEREAKSIKDNTPLLVACTQGHLSVVQYLITEANVDPDAVGKDGSTVLHRAAMIGYLDIVQYLVSVVQFYVEVRTMNSAVQTPLHFACFGGHLSVVQYLVNIAGADSQARDAGGFTPLHYAAFNGHLEVARFLVQEVGVPPHARSMSNRTALELAVKMNHGAVVDLLGADDFPNSSCFGERTRRQKYFDPDSGDIHGRTPLHIAVMNGSFRTVRMLVEYFHVDIGAVDNENKTAVDYAREVCNDEIADFLQKMLGQSSPLVNAARFGDLERCRRLIAKGMSAEAKDEDDRTLLHHAAFYGKIEIVRFLIEDLDVATNERNKYGKTPWEVAVQEKENAVVVFFERHARQMSLSLFESAKAGDLDSTQHLTEKHGCDVQAVDANGWQPLHHACSNGRLNVIKYLVETCGVDKFVATDDEKQSRPVHLAIENNHHHVVQYLMNMEPMSEDDTSSDTDSSCDIKTESDDLSTTDCQSQSVQSIDLMSQKYLDDAL